MRFYLGSGDVRWLERASVPLFLSINAFGKNQLPNAKVPWALDSGAFTELVEHGGWKTTPVEYVARVRRIRATVGMMDFACPQDWICAPPVLAATGKSIDEHQRLTVDNLLELRSLAPEVAWMPALQGWAPSDYERHAQMYAAAGVDLAAEELVGLGSIGLRQDDPIIGHIARHLQGQGIALHGFGVKRTGMGMYAEALASADSMAWSFTARFKFKPSLSECAAEYARGEHPQTCMACLRYAEVWHAETLAIAAGRHTMHAQDSLMEVGQADAEELDRLGMVNTRNGVRAAAAGDNTFVAFERLALVDGEGDDVDWDEMKRRRRKKAR